MSDNPYQSSMDDLDDDLDDELPPVEEDPDRLPTSVKVFGILNICLGGFAVIGALMGLAVSNPQQAALEKQLLDVYGFGRGWVQFSNALNLVLSLALLATGIGLLRRMRLAWQGFVGLCFFNLVTTVAMLIWLTIRVAGMDAHLPMPVRVGVWGGYAAAYLGLVYPVLGLVFMRRRVVKRFFGALGGEDLRAELARDR